MKQAPRRLTMDSFECTSAYHSKPLFAFFFIYSGREPCDDSPHRLG